MTDRKVDEGETPNRMPLVDPFDRDEARKWAISRPSLSPEELAAWRTRRHSAEMREWREHAQRMGHNTAFGVHAHARTGFHHQWLVIYLVNRERHEVAFIAHVYRKGPRVRWQRVLPLVPGQGPEDTLVLNVEAQIDATDFDPPVSGTG